jgi:hypothetical protein
MRSNICGKRAFHRAPVFQHVTDTARTATVVFQHEIIPFVIANQIRAADVNVNVLGHIEVHELAAEMFSGQHVLRRHDTILENFLLMINVVEKEIQCGDALRQTAFEVFPFLGRNDAWQQIKRENFLRAGRIAIDVEGDALPHQGEVHRLPFEAEFFRRDLLQQVLKPRIMWPGGVRCGEHFIEEIGAVVAGKIIRSGWGIERAGHFVTMDGGGKI